VKRFFQLIFVLSLLLSQLLLISCAKHQKTTVEKEISGPSSFEFLGMEMDEDVEEIIEFSEAGNFDLAFKKLDELKLKNKDAVLLHLLRANLLYDQGQEQAALDYLTDQIQKNPDNPDYVFIRGLFLQDQGYILSAKKDYLTTYKLQPSPKIQVLIKLAQIEIADNHLKSALGFLKQAIELEPLNGDLWYQMGKLELKLLDVLGAKLSVEKALKLDDDVDSHQLYIEILSFLKESDLLERQLVLSYQKFPDNVLIALKYSTLLMEKNQLQKAKSVLNQAIALNGDEHKLYFQMATILATEKDFEGAAHFFQEGLKLSPESTWAKVQVAKIYFQLRQYSLAVAFLNQARMEDTTDIFVYEALAKFYNQQGDTFEAERIIIEGLWIEPGNPTLLLEYANLLIKRANYTEAIKSYKKVLEIDQQNYFVLGRLGNLYRITGQFDEAEKALSKAMESNPDVVWVKGHHIELSIELEKWQQALIELDEVIKKNPDDFWAYAQKAFVLHKISKDEKALAAVDMALKRKPFSNWIIEIKSQILESLGRYEESEKGYLQILKDYPENSLIYNKLAFVQLNFDPKKALESIEASMRFEDYDISTLELYLYLTKQSAVYWGFEKNSQEERILGLILKKRFVEAEVQLSKLKKSVKNHLLTYFNKYFQKGNKTRLELPFSVPKDVNSSWVAFYLGMNEINRKNGEKALGYFHRALALSPDNYWVKVKLAYVYELLAEHKKAVGYLREYLAKKPDSLWAELKLALNYDLAKEPSSAEKVYLGILKRRPDEHLALNNLAWLYLTAEDKALKKTDDALELSLRAVAISASSANLDTLAEAYFQKKEYQKALKIIERALDQDRKSLDYFKKQKKKISKALEEINRNKD